MDATSKRLGRAALAAGFAAALIEMVFVLPIQASMGHPPILVFQSIASGLTGTAAYGGGTTSALVGITLHLLISLVSAACYIAAATRLPLLNARPLIGGLLCGVVAYAVMTWIVLPLSAIGYRPTTNPWMMLLSFSIHLFGFGIPLAYVARWQMRPL
ncbi:MAG: hypothetical protein JWM65_817 [Sphingomonas bacterium]|nr:hypothetical protein [Sphingomonas bacterium]